jgi:hypothetical protein
LLQHELIAFRAVSRVKQPSAKAGLDVMKRIAGGRDPGLIEQYVSIPEAQLRDDGTGRN